MALTDAQLPALKQDVTVTRAAVMYQGATLLHYWEVQGDNTLAEFYNQAHDPVWWAYRTDLQKVMITQGVGPEGTTFSWTGQGGFIARQPGEHVAWQELFGGAASGNSMPVDMSRVHNRAAFDDIFSGSGTGAVACRTHVKAVSRRLVTYGERLYATGVGSTADPGTMVFVGSLTADDFRAARALP